MTSLWQLEYGTKKKSFDDWGKLSTPGISFLDQAPDEMSIVAKGRACDSDPLFVTNEPATIWRGNVRWFSGQFIKPQHAGDHKSESQEYLLSGPWNRLERIVYQQYWNTSKDGAVTVVRLASCFLFQNLATGLLVSVKTQLLDALNYAIACGADFQVGTLDASLDTIYGFMREMVNPTIAEVVRTCLQFAPDASVSFDYSFATPKLNITRRPNMTAVELIAPTPALAPALSDLITARLTARDDLKVPAVVLQYAYTSQLNGGAYISLGVDAVPVDATGAEIDAIVETINMTGANTQTLTQAITTQAIAYATAGWWQYHFPFLAGSGISGLTITGGVRGLDESLYPNEVIAGAVPEWLAGTVRHARDRITATLKYTITAADGSISQVTEQKSVDCDATNATTHDSTNPYISSETEGFAEPQPVGLAQLLYDAFNALHYEGPVTLPETECTGRVRPGKVLNITGLKTEWATMRGFVAQVHEDIERGQTSVSLGIPRHLNAADLVDLLRASRARQGFGQTIIRMGGVDAAIRRQLPTSFAPGRSVSSPPTFGKTVHVDPTNADKKITTDPAGRKHEISDGTNSITQELGSARAVYFDGVNNRTIILGTADLADDDTAQFQEIQVCVDGVLKTAKVLMTTPV